MALYHNSIGNLYTSNRGRGERSLKEAICLILSPNLDIFEIGFLFSSNVQHNPQCYTMALKMKCKIALQLLEKPLLKWYDMRATQRKLGYPTARVSPKPYTIS